MQIQLIQKGRVASCSAELRRTTPRKLQRGYVYRALLFSLPRYNYKIQLTTIENFTFPQLSADS